MAKREYKGNVNCNWDFAYLKTVWSLHALEPAAHDQAITREPDFVEEDEEKKWRRCSQVLSPVTAWFAYETVAL